MNMIATNVAVPFVLFVLKSGCLISLLFILLLVLLHLIMRRRVFLQPQIGTRRLNSVTSKDKRDQLRGTLVSYVLK